MAKYEVISTRQLTNFPSDCMRSMPDHHFWMRSRFRCSRKGPKAGIDLTDRKLGLDIGCAHGVVQRQLAARSAWSADGCDLNTAGLSQIQAMGPSTLL